MPEYTTATVISMVAVVLAELVFFKTGIFKSAKYWWSIVIIVLFQIPVDGWLTKLSNPIVIYNSQAMSGVRFPWDIPVEDFGFGFSMVTLTILLWKRQLLRRANV